MNYFEDSTSGGGTVTHYIETRRGGNIILEYLREDTLFPRFLGSPSILIGDIDVGTGKDFPTEDYALAALELAIQHWSHLCWDVWLTPGGIRFFVDTLGEQQGLREQILRSTCSDPIYRRICKRRGYYSARLLPKQGRTEVVKSFYQCHRPQLPSISYSELIALHEEYLYTS